MTLEQKKALCREVLENLSELIEGEATPEVQEHAARLLEICAPFAAYRDTLAATVQLLRECEGGATVPLDESVLRRAVERAKGTLGPGGPRHQS
jgi:hypothetical protein